MSRFLVRRWLAREMAVRPDLIHSLDDRDSPDGRELRYFAPGRGVIVVAVTQTYHEDCWRLEAQWATGRAEQNVAMETEIVA